MLVFFGCDAQITEEHMRTIRADYEITQQQQQEEVCGLWSTVFAETGNSETA